MFCLVSSENEFDELKRCFGKDLHLRPVPQPLDPVERQAELTRFEVVLIETFEFDTDELIKTVEKAKTLLIGNIDTHRGRQIIWKLTSENHYSLVDGEISYRTGRNYSKLR